MKTQFNATTKDLADAFNVSLNTVRSWVLSGILKQGKHYLDLRKANAKNALLRFNIEACQKQFEIPPEKRQ